MKTKWISFGLLAAWLGALAHINLLGAEAQTNVPVQSISLSGASAGSWLTFGLDRIEILRRDVLGNPLWQYLASLIYIILAFYISKFLDYVIQAQLRRWAARTATKFDDLILELLRGPVKIIAFVV